MSLTSKGEEILKNLRKEYGEEKGERVFYAMRNMGKIKGVEGSRSDMSEDEFKEMARLWDKFLGEESEEKEHKEDSAFSELEAKFKKEGKKDPGGLAYAIGEKKYGKEGMEKKSLAGRKDANTTYIDRKLAHVDAICDSVMSHK